MQAVIMAGGEGRRLRPYTTILPKPLMPMGNVPILDILFQQLKHYGFKHIILAVGYLAELIEAYFGSGEKWGLKIEYSREEKNLGTIGPLSLIDNLEDTFLVMNGDILTDLDYRSFYEVHKRSNSIVTIAGYTKQVKIDLGVLEKNAENLLKEYKEKPVFNFQVSMGIYTMDREIVNFIPYNEYYEIPTLMNRLLKEKKPPMIYPFNGKWLDIGRKDDYENALNEFESHPEVFLVE